MCGGVRPATFNPADRANRRGSFKLYSNLANRQGSFLPPLKVQLRFKPLQQYMYVHKASKHVA